MFAAIRPDNEMISLAYFYLIQRNVDFLVICVSILSPPTTFERHSVWGQHSNTLHKFPSVIPALQFQSQSHNLYYQDEIFDKDVFSEDVTVIGSLSVMTDAYDVTGFRRIYRRGTRSYSVFNSYSGCFCGCSTLCYTDPGIVSVHKSPEFSEENLINYLHAINKSVNISHFILVGDCNL
jgi:hypothetical protein